MKSNESNKSIGKLAGQEVNTEEIKGGKRPMKGKHMDPDYGIPNHESVITNKQHLGE